MAALVSILIYLGVTLLQRPDNAAIILLPSLMALGTLLGRLPIGPGMALAAGLIAAFDATLPLVFNRGEIHMAMQAAYLGASLVLIAAAAIMIRSRKAAKSDNPFEA